MIFTSASGVIAKVTATCAEWESAPERPVEVPAIVSVKLRGMTEGPAAMVSVNMAGVPSDGVTASALSKAVTPAGCPVAVSVIRSAKSPSADR